MMNLRIHTPKIPLLGVAAAAVLGMTTSQALELNKGDHVVLIGNALAERMQHHGWLESYAQAAMPDKELVYRNHGLAVTR